LLNSVSQLSRALDKAAARQAPAAKAAHLPDVPDNKANAPWWLDVDVELVPQQSPPAQSAGNVPVASPARLHWLINWRLVGSAAVAAGVVMLVMVYAAWAATTAAPEEVATTPEPVTAPAAPAPPVVQAAAQATPSGPSAEDRLAEIEKQYKDVISRFEATVLVAEKANEQRLLVRPEPAAPAPEPQSKGCFGTAIQFVASPTQAAEEAMKHKKLMLVLTISGNFEESQFT
jgi:hypothetical protein